MDHNIPSHPNPAITALLLAPEMRSLMREKGELAEALWRELVAIRTGRLARSSRLETHIGGRGNDRWTATLTVGGDGADYGIPHEFGHDSDGRPVVGAHELNAALAMLGGM
ncbi:hypothetical protein AB0J48_20520 [Nocardia salmonicida]|uniref:hypothetical protein n=1 Tax=Nocardia salmonicida TaxID=53431 RepID=UPI003434C1ED